MERTVIPNGCHSEGFHLDVFPSPKGHVCISGTNRQHIWHCHRNMVLRMDAANEGPPVLIQPHLSITAVIIYCLHLLHCACTCTHLHGSTERSAHPYARAHFSHFPSITHPHCAFLMTSWMVQTQISILQHRLLNMTFWSFTSCHGTMTKSFWFDLNVVQNLPWKHVILQSWPGLPEPLHKHLCLLVLCSAVDYCFSPIIMILLLS